MVLKGRIFNDATMIQANHREQFAEFQIIDFRKCFKRVA
jgi:hypothetical protein